jgi:hypothetical protein
MTMVAGISTVTSLSVISSMNGTMPAAVTSGGTPTRIAAASSTTAMPG